MSTSFRPFGSGPAPDAGALVRAAMAAMQAQDYPRCAMLAEQATRIDKTLPEAWLLLCAALSKMEAAGAERAMADALAHIPATDPAHLVLRVDRARVLAIQGRHQEAVDLLDEVERTETAIPPRQRDTIGSVFAMVNLFERAEPHCAAAAAALPDSAIAHYNHGTALRYLGRFAEAAAAFERAIALDPDLSLAHATVAQMSPARADANHLARLEAALSRARDDETRARLHYARHKELHDLGRYADAWSALQSGAEIVARQAPFRAAEKRARTDALIETFSAGRLPADDAAPRAGPTPIFVLGLPRSGTTLTERILAAHSRVRAMGETTGVQTALRRTLALAPGEELSASAVRRLGAADFAAAAGHYIANTAFLADGHDDFVTEKLPHNYEWAGPLALMFPASPIVHVRRAPMDSLFGAYRLLFADNAYTWSYTFADLAENYRQYRRLMDHWRAALGGRFFEIALEDIVDDPEAQIRRLLGACGLGFEEACLSPHEVEGGVSTASSAQVRRPINRQGVGAWRRYAEALEPLRAELEREGFVDANGDPV